MQRYVQFKYKIAVLLAIGLGVCAYAIFPKNADIKSAMETYSTTTNTISYMEDGQGSQLRIETTQEGNGAPAANGQTISVHYTGALTDGSVFDSSIPRGEPFELTLGAGQVIKGWDLGLVGMKVGEKRRLTIPPELGYGKQGFPPVIPANATLVFDVELLSIR